MDKGGKPANFWKNQKQKEPEKRPIFLTADVALVSWRNMKELLAVRQNAGTSPPTLGQDRLLLTGGKYNPVYDQML